jgi:hypothetical protein
MTNLSTLHKVQAMFHNISFGYGVEQILLDTYAGKHMSSCLGSLGGMTKVAGVKVYLRQT